MNIEDLENEVQKISKEEIKMRLRRLGINFEKEDEPKEYYVNLYKKAYDLKTSQSNQNTNKTNNQFSFRNLLNNHSLHLYKPEETKGNSKQNNEMKRIFNLSKNYNQPENQINYFPIYNDSNTLFKTERRDKNPIGKEIINFKEFTSSSESSCDISNTIIKIKETNNEIKNKNQSSQNINVVKNEIMNEKELQEQKEKQFRNLLKKLDLVYDTDSEEEDMI